MGWLGILMIGLGVIHFAARDFTWRLTKMGNEMRGVASERGDMWELSTSISGGICVLMGVVLICLGFN